MFRSQPLFPLGIRYYKVKCCLRPGVAATLHSLHALESGKMLSDGSKEEQLMNPFCNSQKESSYTRSGWLMQLNPVDRWLWPGLKPSTPPLLQLIS